MEYKDISYSFDSKLKDVGSYRNRFRIMRRTPQRTAEIISTKSALTGGLTPLTRNEAQFIDTLGTLSVLVKEIDENGKPSDRSDWINKIRDNEILFDLHTKVMDFEDSLFIESSKPAPAETRTVTSAQNSADTPL